MLYAQVSLTKDFDRSKKLRGDFTSSDPILPLLTLAKNSLHKTLFPKKITTQSCISIIRMRLKRNKTKGNYRINLSILKPLKYGYKNKKSSKFENWKSKTAPPPPLSSKPWGARKSPREEYFSKKFGIDFRLQRNIYREAVPYTQLPFKIIFLTCILLFNAHVFSCYRSVDKNLILFTKKYL